MQASLRFFLIAVIAVCISNAANANDNDFAPCLSITGTIANNVSCNTGNDGQINLTITAGDDAFAPWTIELYFRDSGGGLTQLAQHTGVTATSMEFRTGNGSLNQPGADAFGIPANDIDPGSEYRIVVTASGPGNIICRTKQVNGLTVTEPADLVGTVAATTPACTPGSGAIALNVSGGAIPYTFVWTGPTTIGNVEDPTGLNAGTYSVTITDVNECTETVTGIVVPGQPTITLGSNPSVCTGTTSASITYASTLGSPNQYRIDWNAGGPPDVSLTALPSSPIPITGIPLAPGTYNGTLYVSNALCESVGEPISLVVNAVPTAAISYAGNPFCATGTASVTRTGQAGGTYSSTPGLSINGSTGEINLAASTSGIYTVTYDFTNGTCPNATTTSVTINAVPTAAISYAGNPFCATGTASVTRTGQAGGTYSSTPGLSINGSTGEINLAASTAGIYTVTYDFTNGTCPNATTTSVTINAVPTAAISYAGNPFCATGTASVTRTGQAGGTYSSTPGLSINGSTGEINLAASTAGIYTVTYDFTNGTCPNATTTSVTINAVPTAAISYAGNPFCATGTASVTRTGQAGGTYSSTPGLSINGSTGEINLAASTAGIYTVTYDFTNGTCPNATTTSVTINAVPTAAISYAGNPFCATGTASVTRTGQAGGTYSSTPGLSINGSTGEINLAASTAGIYTVTYDFTNGTCPNATTTSVTINAVPTAAISYAGNPFCATGTASVTRTGQAGGTYSSTPGLSINGSTGEINLAASTAGIYTVTYDFTNGTCPNATTTSVTINAVPTAAISYAGNPFCATGTASVTRTGQAGGTYSSTPGLSINGSTGEINLAASTAGIYTVTYDFTNGTCPNATTTSVTINAVPTAAISYAGNPFCATGTASVTRTGQAGGTYSSTPGLSINGSTGEINLAASTAGIYTVTYDFTNGTCPNATTTSVTINAVPTAAISYAGNPFCATGTASVTRTGQAGGTYSSTPGLSINGSTGEINLAASTSGIYTVTYDFTNGTCPNATTTSVTINAVPTAAISYAGNPFCATGTASVTRTGQAGGTYSSTPGLSINGSTGEINLAASTSGIYTVTYDFTNGTCPNATTTSVTINAVPTAAISYAGNPFCATGTASVTRTGQAGGTYSSTPGLSINGSTGEINLAASTAGIYTVTYDFTNGTCPNATTTSVTINAVPTAAISYAGNPFCATGTASVTRTGQAGGTYSSTPGLSINGSTGEINLAASTAGIYTVTYDFTNGTCPNATTTSVTINAVPTAAISYAGNPFCATGTASVTRTGQAGGTYSSTPGLSINGSTGEINLAASTSGIYTVTYDFTNGTCPNATTTSVTINAVPTATISGTTSICDGQNATVTINFSVPGTSWDFVYSDGSTNFPISTTLNPYTFNVTPSSTTTYTLLSVADASCTGTVSGTATVTINTPVLNLPATTICEDGGIVDLTTIVSATPAGGTFTFTGTNVTGNNFDPTGLTGVVQIQVGYTEACPAPTGTLNLTVTTSAAMIVPVTPVEVCEGAGSVDLNAYVSGTPGDYVFSGHPAINTTNDTFNPSGLSGLQTITVDYVGACTAPQVSFTIDVIAAPALSTFSTVTCANAAPIDLRSRVSVSATGGIFTFSGHPNITAGYMFNSSGITGPAIVNISVSYALTGCSVVNNTIAINILDPTDPACSGGNCATVVITPVATPDPCLNPAGEGTVTFNIDPAVPAFNPSGVIITIDKIIIAGEPAYNLTQHNNPLFTALRAGNYTYQIIYGDASCTKTGFFTVPSSGSVGTPIASVETSPFCADGTGSVKITVPERMTGAPLEWSLDGVTWSSFQNEGIITGIPVGLPPSYDRIINVRETAADDCPASVRVNMQSTNPPIVFNASNYTTTQTTCNNNDGTLQVISLPTGGGSGPYSYRLNGIFFNTLPAGNTFTGLSAGSHLITIIDNFGCEFDVTFTITFPGYINTTTPVAVNADCASNGTNGQITFTITDPGTYQYAITTDPTFEPGASDYTATGGLNVVIPNLIAGEYYIWLKSSASLCPTRLNSVTISGVVAVSFDIIDTVDEICFEDGGSIVLGNIVGALGVDYTYEFFNGTSSTIAYPESLAPYSISGLTPGTYQVRLAQNQILTGCEFKTTYKSFEIVGPSSKIEILSVNSTKSYPEQPTGSITVNVKGSGRPFTDGSGEYYTVWADKFLGTPPATIYHSEEVFARRNPIDFEAKITNLPFNEGVEYYAVFVQDALGCVAIFNDLVDVEVDTEIFVPNVFTPNGDDKNETFYVRNLPASGNSLSITNRWGKEVYSSKNYTPETLWNGGGAPDGVYFYRLQISGGKTFTGWVEIIRGSAP